jgi:hypothetical protein
MRHGQVGELDGLHSRMRVRILEGIKVLHQANDSVTSLSKGVLLWKMLASQSHPTRFPYFNKERETYDQDKCAARH